MAKYAILKSFYASERWLKFRNMILADRNYTCEHCNKVVAVQSDLTLHHIIELTPENVSNINISLNPENVMVVHHDCHNKIHNRFGHIPERGVYIVYGAPLSGKKTFVKSNITRGDIVVDMDQLYKAVTMLDYYDKPDSLFSNVISLHNLLIDNIKTRYGKWRSAFIIGGYADKYKREKLCDDLGAELIFCDVSKDECIRRLEADEVRQYRKNEWIEYINKWFKEYIP